MPDGLQRRSPNEMGNIFGDPKQTQNVDGARHIDTATTDSAVPLMLQPAGAGLGRLAPVDQRQLESEGLTKDDARSSAGGHGCLAHKPQPTAINTREIEQKPLCGA